MKTEFFFAKVKSVNVEDRTLDAAASTRDLDRDNDIILPDAFRQSIDSFIANPVILATHQHRLSTGSSPVIGSAIPELLSITDNEVLFRMRFAETALGDEYWQLYRDGHMRAFSIGFIPLEWRDEKDEKLGYIRTYTKIELLEISAVPVPSNRRALARAKGFYENDEIEMAISDALDERFEPQKEWLEKELNEIKSIIICDRGELADELLGGEADDEHSACADDEAAEKLLETLQSMSTQE